MVRKIIRNGKGSIICDERRGVELDANAYEALSDILNPAFYAHLARTCAKDWFNDENAGVTFINGINEELAISYCVKFYYRFDENEDKFYDINFKFKLLDADTHNEGYEFTGYFKECDFSDDELERLSEILPGRIYSVFMERGPVYWFDILLYIQRYANSRYRKLCEHTHEPVETKDPSKEFVSGINAYMNQIQAHYKS